MISASTLNFYVNMHVSMICPNGYDQDNINHCVHFVGHVLGIQVGASCSTIVGGQRALRASIRVDEIFNMWCPSVGEFDSKPNSVSQGLIFIINEINVRLNPKHMGNVGTKHMGVFVGGSVWHYSNGRHKVVSVPVSQMRNHFPSKKDNYLFYGTLK